MQANHFFQDPWPPSLLPRAREGRPRTVRRKSYLNSLNMPSCRTVCHLLSARMAAICRLNQLKTKRQKLTEIQLVDRLIEAGIHEAFGFVLSTRRPTTLLRAVILLGVALQVQLLWDLLLLVLCLAPHCVEFGVRLSGFSVIVSSSALLEIYKPMTSEATIWRSKKMETNGNNR